MGKVAAVSHADIEDLLFQLRTECAAIDRAIALVKASQRPSRSAGPVKGPHKAARCTLAALPVFSRTSHPI